MGKLGYQDFHFRQVTLGRVGYKSIPETKECFLKRVDQIFKDGRRRIVNVETRQDGLRVWYMEE